MYMSQCRILKYSLNSYNIDYQLNAQMYKLISKRFLNALSRRHTSGSVFQNKRKLFGVLKSRSSKTKLPSSFINYKTVKANWLFLRDVQHSEGMETLQPQIKVPQKSAVALSSPSRINKRPPLPPKHAYLQSQHTLSPLKRHSDTTHKLLIYPDFLLELSGIL